MIMRNDWEEAFIDASFWIALVNRRDDHHDDAVAQWRFVNENGLRRATTNWTLYEALTERNRSGRPVDGIGFAVSVNELRHRVNAFSNR